MDFKVVNDVSIELIDHMGSDLSVVNAARVSFDKWHDAFEEEQDYRLIKYLAKHGHWSPFAHTSMSFRCKVPMFLARQLVKHQVGLTWNEVSRRYTTDNIEFYVPTVLHSKADNVKQGCGVELVDGGTLDELRYITERAFASYNWLLDRGVAPEEARMVLPMNLMTTFIWTGSLYAFWRVYKLRIDTHAQKIAQSFAEKLYIELARVYPYCVQALSEV